MNSALKPVLAQPGVPQPGGQSSPAKGNVATVNHAVGHPQGAQNSLHLGNNLVGHNLTHHAPAPPLLPHAVPSMAPISANMAQMAQNMSHHGNLSHVTQNSVAPAVAASPSKTTSSPLSLVQDKANTSQPLALTRTPEKKDADSTGPANGTIDSTKSGTNTPNPLKPQNPESNKEKQDIAKTSPSTPKPPEKTWSGPPQKSETSNSNNQTEGSTQPKMATANEPPEKSPLKPIEIKPSPAADVAPSQSDSKPETAKDSQLQEKASPTEIVSEVKVEKPKDTKEETKIEPQSSEVKNEDKVDSSKKEEQTEQKPQSSDEKIEEKKLEPKQIKVDNKPKSTLKLATVTPPMRKRRQTSLSKTNDGSTPAKKSVEDASSETRMKRNRTKVQLYQSPTPELAMATKLSASAGRSTPTKPNDDKLIVFYKNEYLAVRNAEGGFYVCQTMQNVYRTTRKIKIRWLSQDKSSDPSGETYKPDFYDITDMECVLTTLSLSRAPGGGGAQLLKPAEAARASSILERALKAEHSGGNNIELTEEHPDGLDLSLYTDESQLDKKSRKRNSSKSSPRSKLDFTDDDARDDATPVKKARTMPKRSPKSARKTKSSASPTKQSKRKSAGSKAAASKTATPVTDKSKKSTPTKRTVAKHKDKLDTPPATTTRKGRRTSARELKPSPIVPTPSTSTGKTTRTPRKPPSKK